MNITTTMANRILKELTDYSDYQIGIINSEGIIMAHTQQNLEGQYCPPASRICHAYMIPEITVTYAESDFSSNSFPGIYYPIRIQKELFFILLVHFGKEIDFDFTYAKLLKGLCQMTTEKLISSGSFRASNYGRDTFLIDWINGNLVTDTQRFFLQGSAYQLDVSHDTACAILSISHSSINAFMELSLENLFEKYQLLNVKYNDQYVIILSNPTMEQITKRLQNFAEALLSVTNRFLISVGNIHNNMQLHLSYHEALKVSSYYANTTFGIKYYQNEVINLYLYDAPEDIKRSVVEQMFANYSSQERMQIYELVNIYTECNGSLQKIAKRLFIHKNTVQYRIEQLKKNTGYDLRNLADYNILYLACNWLKH